MKLGFKQVPPSRREKKQIVAHLDPALVEAVHRRRTRDGVTIQEIIAMAVNAALARFGRAPILEERRDRLVKRQKALARVQDADKVPRCRAGKRRLAAWFDMGAVDRVAAFSAEIGTRIEDIVEMGLREIVSEEELEEARAAMASPEAA